MAERRRRWPGQSDRRGRFIEPQDPSECFTSYLYRTDVEYDEISKPDNGIRTKVFDNRGSILKDFGSYGNSEGEFDCLAGVAVNRIGQYIIADRYNHRIQVILMLLPG